MTMRRIIGSLFIIAIFLTTVIGLNGVRVYIEKQDTLSRENPLSREKSLETISQAPLSLDSSFSSHLPLVIIETNGQQIEKETEIWVEISVINQTDKANEEAAAATIKYRGKSSYSMFDKKQYRIEFREGFEKEKNKNYSVMGMSAASDWVLNGPFLDRSLVRNRVIYGISRELLSWAPDTQYCEVFLNGEYQGLYLMIEAVTNEKGRLNLADFGLVSGQTAYILKRDRANTEENEFDSYGTKTGETSYQLSISYPTPSRLTETQYRWIENDINQFERVLYSDQFDDPVKGYAAYIDVQSFVDYYIINELTLNTDAGYLSTIVYKDLGGKLKTTVWDFNNAFNNYPIVKSVEKFYVAESNWFDRLFQDRNFTDQVVARYKELRKGEGVLSEENLLRLVDENVAYLGDAVDRNFELWGYTFKKRMLFADEEGNSRDPKSYEEAVQQLKSCIVLRGNFLDENIELLYQYAEN